MGAFGVLASIIALDVSASVYLLVNDLLQYHVLTFDLCLLKHGRSDAAATDKSLVLRQQQLSLEAQVTDTRSRDNEFGSKIRHRLTY